MFNYADRVSRHLFQVVRRLPNATHAMCVAIILASLTELATGAEYALTGTVTVDGIVAKDVYLELASKKGHVCSIYVKDDGTFSTTFDSAENGDVLIRPSDSRAWAPKSTSILSGGEVFTPKPETTSGSVQLSLKSIPLEMRPLTISSDSSDPVSIPISCSVRLLNNRFPQFPAQTWSWQTSSDKGGNALLTLPKSLEGSYSLVADSVDKEDNRYTGEKVISFDTLRAPLPPTWVLKKQTVSLIIQVKWDEAFSKEPFRPNVSHAIAQHTLILKGPEIYKTLIGVDGKVKMWGMKPGEYGVDLIDEGKAWYVVKKKAGTIVVDPKASAPQVAEITVAPRTVVQFTGTIVDAESKAPLPKARISIGGAVVSSGDDGKFFIEGASDDSAEMLVEAPAHQMLRVKVGKGNDLGTLAVIPFPLMTGEVSNSDDPKTVVPFAVLEFIREKSTAKCIADEKGQYSIRLPPGDYRVVISRRFKASDETNPQRHTSKIAVLDTSVKMPPDGTRQNFSLKGVGQANVTIGNWLPGKQERKLIIALVGVTDNKVVAAAELSDNGAGTNLQAVEGEYKVLIAENEQSGQFVGKTTVEAGKTSKIVVKLDKWVKISPQSDGSLKVGE